MLGKRRLNRRLAAIIVPAEPGRIWSSFARAQRSGPSSSSWKELIISRVPARVGHDMNHFDLLSKSTGYERIRRWLAV